MRRAFFRANQPTQQPTQEELALQSSRQHLFTLFFTRFRKDWAARRARKEQTARGAANACLGTNGRWRIKHTPGPADSCNVYLDLSPFVGFHRITAEAGTRLLLARQGGSKQKKVPKKTDPSEPKAGKKIEFFCPRRWTYLFTCLPISKGILPEALQKKTQNINTHTHAHTSRTP